VQVADGGAARVARDAAAITHPSRLWSRAEVLARPSPVPREPGVYGWYFKTVPGAVDTRECLAHGGLVLLYVGIAPREPAAGGPASGATLRVVSRQVV
jgi:hypothetical protein